MLQACGRDLLPALDALAYLLHYEGDLEGARDAYLWSTDLRRQHFGHSSVELADSLNGLGNIEADLGNALLGEELKHMLLEHDRESFEK